MAFHAKLKETSNQSDWSCPVQFLSRADSTLVDLTGDTFNLALVPAAPLASPSYRSWPGYGSGAPVLGRAPVLVGSTTTGELTITGPGLLYIYFPATRMQALPPGMYRVGLTVTNGSLTAQVIIGYLPVRDGVVAPASALRSA